MLALATVFAATLPVLSNKQIVCTKDVVTSDQACAWREFGHVDAEMNAVWRIALASAEKIDRRNLDSNLSGMGPSEISTKQARAALLESQRAFLIYRQETCNFIRHINSPGSKAPTDQAYCLAKITKDRIHQLRDFRILESP